MGGELGDITVQCKSLSSAQRQRPALPWGRGSAGPNAVCLSPSACLHPNPFSHWWVPFTTKLPPTLFQASGYILSPERALLSPIQTESPLHPLSLFAMFFFFKRLHHNLGMNTTCELIWWASIFTPRLRTAWEQVVESPRLTVTDAPSNKVHSV